jgi:hypothetical protein
LKTIEKWPTKFENFSFGTGVPSAQNDLSNNDNLNNIDNDNMESYEGNDDDYEDESSIVLDKYGNTIEKNDNNNNNNENNDNNDIKIDDHISENKDSINIKNEIDNNVIEVTDKVSSACDYDYEEEEEEDDDRNVEYIDDSNNDLDLCCINVTDAIIQKTCVLCNIEK